MIEDQMRKQFGVGGQIPWPSKMIEPRTQPTKIIRSVEDIKSDALYRQNSIHRIRKKRKRGWMSQEKVFKFEGEAMVILPKTEKDF